VAVSRMAAAYHDAVTALLEGPQYELGIYAAGTWDPHYFHILRIFHPVQARKVRTCIGTPVAAECQDLRLPAALIFY